MRIQKKMIELSNELEQKIKNLEKEKKIRTKKKYCRRSKNFY